MEFLSLDVIESAIPKYKLYNLVVFCFFFLRVFQNWRNLVKCQVYSDRFEGHTSWKTKMIQSWIVSCLCWCGSQIQGIHFEGIQLDAQVSLYKGKQLRNHQRTSWLNHRMGNQLIRNPCRIVRRTSCKGQWKGKILANSLLLSQNLAIYLNRHKYYKDNLSILRLLEHGCC